MRRLVPLALALLAACSPSAEPSAGAMNEAAVQDEPRGPAASGASTKSEHAEPRELELRLSSPRVPDYLFRLTENKGQISGHVVLHVAGGGASELEPGEVRGTLDEDGSVILSIEPPASPRTGAQTTFSGTARDDGFEGVLDWRGRFERVKLAVIAPGTLDDQGVPLVARTRHTSTSGDCSIDVSSAEFFGLEVDPLERTLNEQLRSVVDGAPSACTSGVDVVAGGGLVTLVTPEIVSIASLYSLLQGDEYFEPEPPVRHSYDMSSGRELALFGDVLAPGSEPELVKVLDAAVASFRDDVLTESDRVTLQAILRGMLDDGELALHYGLTDDGIVFDTPGFTHPRITGVVVPYGSLGSLLVRSDLMGR